MHSHCATKSSKLFTVRGSQGMISSGILNSLAASEDLIIYLKSMHTANAKRPRDGPPSARRHSRSGAVIAPSNVGFAADEVSGLAQGLVADSVSHPHAGGRRGGQGAAGPGTGRRHRPREEREVDGRQVWQVAHPPPSPGAPERAGHHDHPGAARPRHHRRAAGGPEGRSRPMTVLIWLFLHPTAVAVCRRLTHRMANSMKSILLSFASLLALALLPFGSRPPKHSQWNHPRWSVRLAIS